MSFLLSNIFSGELDAVEQDDTDRCVLEGLVRSNLDCYDVDIDCCFHYRLAKVQERPPVFVVLKLLQAALLNRNQNQVRVKVDLLRVVS